MGNWPLTGQALADFNRMLSDWKQYSTFPFIGPDDINRLYNVLIAAGLKPQLEDVGNRPQYWLLQLAIQAGSGSVPIPPPPVGSSGIHWSPDETQLTGINFNGGTFSSLSSPSLQTIGGSGVDLGDCESLIALNLSSLVFVGADFHIADCLILTELSLPSLASISGSIRANNATQLNIVSFPLYLPVNGSGFQFFNCSLSETSVDHILARCVANPAYVSGTIDLSGGTSSAPSSVGPGSDYDILINRGVVVTVNP